MKKVLKNLKVTLNGAALRTATFEDREYLVAPVIALVEGVIHPINAVAPELVPAEVLAVAPSGWNGRPVVMNHPQNGDERVSANDPKVLETYSFGMLFNTVFEDDKLKTEAWLDPIKARKVGDEAVNTIDRLKANEDVEVSVGAFVLAEKKSGVHEGEEYYAVWSEVVPDHLAMLSEGSIGACSVDMGCGAPRAAEADRSEQIMRFLMGDGPTTQDLLYDLAEVKSKYHFRSGADDGDMSDVDLRHMLDAALRAVEPGYLGVEMVFPNEQSVVYAVMPEDNLLFFQRTYTLGDNEVSIEDNATEVIPVTRFEAAQTKKENEMSKCCKEKMAVLVSRGVFAEGADVELTEEQVDKLIEVTEPPKAEMTEEEWLAVGPPELVSIITEHRVAAKKEHEELVKELSEKQDAIPLEELQAKDLKELRQLKKLTEPKEPAGDPPKDPKVAADFRAQGLPRSDGDDDVIPPAPSLAERLKANRAN